MGFSVPYHAVFFFFFFCRCFWATKHILLFSKFLTSEAGIGPKAQRTGVPWATFGNNGPEEEGLANRVC